MTEADGRARRGPAYELTEVEEVPESVDLRKMRAPLRLLLTKVAGSEAGRTFRLATYPKTDGAPKAAQRLRKRYPELVAKVDLETRNVELDGGGVGSALYATRNQPEQG